MKTVSKLSVLALALLASACNEKVSPELMQGNAAVPDDVIIPPSEYYFSIANESSPLLNYKLHKTGANNNTAACEVRNNTGLSSDIFRGNPAANDITCYFDAEELTLYHAGMSLSVNSGPNSCDYVGYSPFGFYDNIPGDSTSSYLEVECATPTVMPAHIVTAAGAAQANVDITSPSGTMRCGEIASQTIDSGSRVRFQIENDNDLCVFDYSDNPGGENCDVGTITINKLVVSHTPETADTAEVITGAISTRKLKCGGKVSNCVKGPIKLLNENSINRTEISNSPINQPYSKKYEFEALIDQDGQSDEDVRVRSLKTYSNFRRNLASKHINYISNSDPTYKDAFGESSVGTQFDPQVMDYYSKNLTFNGTNFVTPAMITTHSNHQNRRFGVPFAAEPFLGIGAYQVNPFYTFYCYDRAFDIKARIRMVLRDWDRIPTGTQFMDYISDVWRGLDSRQDDQTIVEIPGEPDPYFLFNDLTDWDDQIPMERTPNDFDKTLTIWGPTPAAGYPNGFFNPALFTRGNL